MKTISLLAWLAIAATALAQQTVPSGTILPVRLNSAINRKKSQPGKIVTARLMQDVQLGNGMRFRAGSKVIGRILGMSETTEHRGAIISLRFDAIKSSKKRIPITTDLRALASPLEVDQAQIPKFGPDRGTPETSWTTEQVGGDTVYRGGGPVTAGSRVVGKPVPNGVLVESSAMMSVRCAEQISDNLLPQSLWVFSAGACGVYGYSDLEIEHAGQTAPVGEIKLVSEKHKLNLRTGTGLLLRVR